MSGFATLAAMVITTSILFSIVNYTFTGNLNAGKKSSELIETQSSSLDKELRTKLRIDSITILSGGQQVKANITNTGTQPIKVAELEYADLVLSYTTTVGAAVSQRLTYSFSGSDNTWKINNVFTDGRQGEGVSPIDLSQGSSGHWDPNEQLEIKATLPSSAAVDILKPLTMVLSTDNGVTARLTV